MAGRRFARPEPRREAMTLPAGTLDQSRIRDRVAPFDDVESALSTLVPAADRVPYFDGSSSAALATFTSFGRSVVAAANAAAARTLLALGTLATQAADAVAITGGTVDGTAIGGTTAAAGKFTTLEATAAVKFGTHSALGGESVTGYIEITDASGATRKIAVVS